VAQTRNRRRVDRASEPAGTGAAGRGRLLLGLATLGLAALTVALAWRGLERTHAFAIRTITFEGLSRATADELLALSPVKPGDHLLLSDVDGMEAALERSPWVRHVEAHRRWPPALLVKVTERKAAALIDLGGLYLVDGQAEVFKRAAPGDGLDLPVITGISRAEFLARRSAVVPVMAGALALARSWKTAGWDAAVPLSEIHVDPWDGTTIYVGDEGTEVRLGSGDLPAKLSRLRQVLAALRADGKKAEVLHLDNRLHPSWVAVRLAGAEVAPKVSGR
jgi:cell division protein FtsQ